MILFHLGVFALLFALPTSPAVMSISVGLLVAAGVWQLRLPEGRKRLAQARGWWGWPLLVALVALSGLYTDNTSGWLDELRIKLPLLLLPPALAALPAPNAQWRHAAEVWFLVVVSAVAAATAINYTLHFEEYNARILQQKEVQIVSLSAPSHIYFSILNALGIWVGWRLWRSDQWLWRPAERYGYLVLAVFLFITLHVFAARTGLGAFYLAVGAECIRLIVRMGRPWVGLAVLAGLLALPVASYYALPSFRNRVWSTLDDIERFRAGTEDISNLSVGRRLAAWQTALHTAGQQPLLGVGPADVRAAVDAQYAYEPFILKPENRIPDLHNQYLEIYVGLGLVGLTVFILAFLIQPWRQGSFARADFRAFWWVMAGAMLVESTLERQLGVTCFAFFWWLYQVEPSPHPSPHEPREL